MIIEFVGVPASGKTILRDQLVALLDEIGVETLKVDQNSAIRRIFHKAKTIVVYRKVLLIAMAALLRDSRSLAIRMRSIRWVIATLDQYSSTQRGREGVVILDEGVLQRTVLLFFSPASPPQHALLNRYLNVIPYPSVVIRLVLEPGNAAIRYTRRLSEEGPRPNERFSGLSESLEDVLTDIEGFLTVVLSRAGDIAAYSLVQISSGGAGAIDTLRREVIPLIIQGLERGQDLAGGRT